MKGTVAFNIITSDNISDTTKHYLKAICKLQNTKARKFTLVFIWFSFVRLFACYDEDCDDIKSRRDSDAAAPETEQQDMASLTKSCAPNLALALEFALILALVSADADGTKTAQFEVQPGGVVHTFTQAVVSDRGNYRFVSHSPPVL